MPWPRFSDLIYPLASIWKDRSNHGQRLRRVLAFFAWQARKRFSRSPIRITLFNHLNFLAYSDCDISASALYYALPNSREIEFLRRHLSGGTFIDVGANVGLMTLLVADKVNHAILFEPNPLGVERARENLRLNDLKFDVYLMALSNKVGSIPFESLGKMSSCNRVVDGFATSLPTIRVQRTTLDRLIQEVPPLPAPIKAIKIDVEGHENSVLEGMRETLRVVRPKIVMFEYLQRTDMTHTIRLFRDVGYTIFELSASGPRIATVHVMPLQDLFACPDEYCELFGIEKGTNKTQAS
jgi:FkbM family methyltransferase